ncbi:MAG: AAA family ATPase, partial [Fidelibacterota bacterium]
MQHPCDYFIHWNYPIFTRLRTGNGYLEPPYQKAKLIRAIRDTLRELNDSQRIQPILILDEVQLVKNSLLEQLRLLTNFAMDSRQLLTTILSCFLILKEKTMLSIYPVI